MRLTILHTNDIHGRQERIAQIATLVRTEKERAGHTVLYLDAGDVEETANRLSSLTKGTAMHRLMNHAHCDAATVGNACWIRYGPGILAEHARAAEHPHLLANFEPVSGPVPHVLLGDVGVVGVTAPFKGWFTDVDWGFEALDELEVVRASVRELRSRGAKLVVLLSHLGLDEPHADWDDRRIAAELQGEVDVIVGAHTHDLLPQGEWIGRVLVTQAGSFGEQLGRIEIDGDARSATVEPVPDDVAPHPAVAEEAKRIEQEIEVMLAEPLGTVDEPLDAQWIAEMLRRRFAADAAVFGEAMTLATLPPGLVTRGALWEASETTANPGVTELTGAQLLDLLERAGDPGFMAGSPRSLRGRPRGRLFLAGPAPDEIDRARVYTVAGSDWELDTHGGYALAEWGLTIRYEFPIIIREAIEEHLRAGD